MFYAAQFTLRPWRIAGTLTRIARGRPDTMLERMLEGILVRIRGLTGKPRRKPAPTLDGARERESAPRREAAAEKRIHDAA